MTIGQRIKKRREELNLSIDEVAKKLNKNRATIYRYENGEIEKLPIDIVEPLSKALDCSPAYLMGWESDLNPTNEHLNIFGNRLKEIRKKRGYTLDALADLYNQKYETGLNKGTLSKYENNKQEPMISVVGNLAKLLNVSVDYLLCNDESPKQFNDLDNENPDIRMIARAGKKMSGEQAENLRKIAEYLYPEAFGK